MLWVLIRCNSNEYPQHMFLSTHNIWRTIVNLSFNYHQIPSFSVLLLAISLEAGSYSMYRNDLKFSDRHAWANSADPDQTEEQFGQGLHCLPFCMHRLDILLYGRAT